ncbi:dTDP-4-dehydrorhamnose 3,5-epimerase [Thermodesulfobacteriota bacterium]
MKITKLNLEGAMIIEPDVFQDDRGYFLETYQKTRYRKFGIDVSFVQDNLSFSTKETLRGLHFQYPQSQAKLVQVIQGEVLDMIVDIRRGSPTFGCWGGVRLSEKNHKQLFVPEGFAHGYCVLSDKAVFSYKCSDFYALECEKGVLWSDQEIGIDWPVKVPVLSEKDRQYPFLKNIPDEDLPEYHAVL